MSSALLESLKRIGDRVEAVKSSAQTEEATKTALVLPFLQALGYDVFNPREVVPEYVCDFGTKKSEKIDYAICEDGAPVLLIECKHWGRNLDKHDGQLFRYFAVSKAKFGVLTNGVEYRFYGDLDNPNVMDDSPFFTYRIDAPERDFESISRFQKSAFEPSSVAAWANAQKDSARIKSVLVREFSEPSADFIRTLVRQLEISPITQKTLDQFAPIVKKAVDQIFNDRISAAFARALNESTDVQPTIAPSVVNAPTSEPSAPDAEASDEKARIHTSIEEIEAFFIVRSILRSVVPPQRVVHRDTISYFGILLDDNNRKPICRLYLERDGVERKKKCVGLFDEERNERRESIETIDDLYRFENDLKATVERYLNAGTTSAE